MAIILQSLLVCVLCSCFVGSAKLPNIVFVLVDDWGFADVGFKNPAISSPNFDNLAKTGLVLNRHYVFKYCSPSRASFLTGRWPHHAHQWNIYPTHMAGTNLKMTMLPAKLKKANYATHMVGKWHQGFFDPRYLPINRGFDTSCGFLNGAEDHMTQKVGCAVDYWKNDGPDPRNGTYDSYYYRDDLTNIVSNHNVEKPLFIYLPLHNIHGPLEAPDEWLDIYSANSTCALRRTLQAMVSVADNVTGHLVELLKKKGMWDNTLMVVSADNGGCGSSNYPLKGGKMGFFEGGVRSLAFVNGGLLTESRRGQSTDGFIHIADWYTTFCKLAGVDHDDSGTGKFPVDGLDVWPIITGENEKTQHDEIVLGYNFDYNNPGQGAIIVGDYKLVVGLQGNLCGSLMWSPLDHPCSRGVEGPDCDPYCLYDIVNDPSENNELSKQNPEMLKKLLDRYNSYSKEPRDMQDQGYHSNITLPIDPNACDYMTSSGGSYWRPWKNV